MNEEKQSCDQCDWTVINGIFCHEFGCPNNTPEENWEYLELFPTEELMEIED